jgi:hypothetical protein
MYVTTIAATGITAWNLYKTVATRDGVATISVLGAWAMIIVAILLVVAAIMIAIDGWKSYSGYERGEVRAEPVPTA